MIEFLLALDILSVQYCLWIAWRIQTGSAYPGRWKYASAAALCSLPAATWTTYMLVFR